MFITIYCLELQNLPSARFLALPCSVTFLVPTHRQQNNKNICIWPKALVLIAPWRSGLPSTNRAQCVFPKLGHGVFSQISATVQPRKQRVR